MVLCGKFRVVRRYLSSCIQLGKQMVDTNIAGMRIDYDVNAQLDTEDLPEKDPMKLFEIWFAEAKNCKRIEEPNAMTLATSTRFEFRLVEAICSSTVHYLMIFFTIFNIC